MSTHPVLPPEESVLHTVDKKNLYKDSGKIKKKHYKRELERLQEELVRLQMWVKEQGLRVIVLFDGRDAAGKGGTIHRITRRTSSRVVKVVALGKPTEREQSQWYFQRYVEHLPAAGEMVLFDRSWYNRATVERVMGFCTDAEYEEFIRSVPEFERMLRRSGIVLVKYWFSISDEEQERRFQKRTNDPTRRWKLSPLDLEARERWADYSRAKDPMFERPDTVRVRVVVPNLEFGSCDPPIECVLPIVGGQTGGECHVELSGREFLRSGAGRIQLDRRPTGRGGAERLL